jgi:predicted metal-dependent peptidase
MTQRSTELTEALSAFINQSPFFAVLLFNLLEVHETNEIPTAATDGKRVLVNPAFFKKLPVPERVFVLAHETSHVILQHPDRMKAYRDLGYGPDLKPFSTNKYNHAADYVINSWLNDIGVGKQPLGTLLNSQYGKDDLVDDIYCKLPDEPEDDSGQGDGWDTHMPSSGDPSAQGPSKSEIQRAVKMGAAAQQAMGKMPAGMQRLVDEICEPQVHWEDHLRRTIITMYGNDEASWARPNRRKLAAPPHIYWPGRVGNRAGAIAIELDSSGSISDEIMAKYMPEVASILQDVRPEKIYAMWVDAALYNDEVVEMDDPMDVAVLRTKAGGGGGTDMTVVFREIEKRELAVEYVIILTDGYTPFGEDTGIPTIWCITTKGITAPWGETIHIKI